MKAVVQRVSEAEVTVAGTSTGRIGAGLVVLLGVAADDEAADVDVLAEKLPRLRIFENAAGKFDRSLTDTGGAVLVVSQFTLLADTRKGRRPSFTASAAPGKARELYERFVEALRRQGLEVATGVFGEHMDVRLTNDGPVTLVLDTRDWRPR